MRAYICLVCAALAAALFVVYASTYPAQLASGCRSGSGEFVIVQRHVQPFNTVEAAGPLNIRVTQASSDYVEVKADDNIIPLIRTESSDGVLKVYFDEGCILSMSPVTVGVYMEQPAALYASGGARISTNGQVDAKDFILSAGRDSVVVATVYVRSLHTFSTHGGEVMVGGVSDFHRAVANASGGILSYGLLSQVGEAEAKSGGYIQAHVRDELTADAADEGRIYYMGGARLKKQLGDGGLIDRTD
jgi:hypothetical protein